MLADTMVGLVELQRNLGDCKLCKSQAEFKRQFMKREQSGCDGTFFTEERRTLTASSSSKDGALQTLQTSMTSSSSLFFWNSKARVSSVRETKEKHGMILAWSGFCALCWKKKTKPGQHLALWKDPVKERRSVIMSFIVLGAFEESGAYLSHLWSAVEGFWFYLRGSFFPCNGDRSASVRFSTRTPQL